MGAAASAQKNFDQFVGSDGKLDLQEFGLMFKNAGQGGAVSQEQIVKLFEAFDRSGDGEVDRKEYLKLSLLLHPECASAAPPRIKSMSTRARAARVHTRATLCRHALAPSLSRAASAARATPSTPSSV